MFWHQLLCVRHCSKDYSKPRTAKRGRCLKYNSFSQSGFSRQRDLVPPLSTPSIFSSSSCVRRLPCLTVTSTLRSAFPSVTWFRMQFLRKMWTLQLAFVLCTVSANSCPPWVLYNNFHFLNYRSTLLQHHLPNLSAHFSSNSQSSQVSAPYKAMVQM